MYLHLGQDTVIKMDEIVGIFDLETATVSKISRDYLARAQKSGQVVNVSLELPKSFVVCRDETGRLTVYISQISTATLLKRNRVRGRALQSLREPSGIRKEPDS